jgi:LysM repeat protein
MRRELFFVVVGLGGLSIGCGDAAEDALATLPPIKTTTTTTTTTTTPDSRRIFYEVKSGDFLSDIARRYEVTVDSIMELNGLTSDVLQVGQMLEIPNDIRVDATLPPLPSSTDAT